MKKLLFGMSAFAILFAASCQRELDSVTGEGLVNVTFKVSTPTIATRAYSDGTTATALQYAVYDAAGVQITELSETEGTLVNNAANVTLQLTTGNEYAVVFWAAAPNAPYTVDLANKTMTVDYTNAESNDEDRDAFYVYHTFTVSGAQTETLELKRPFAQLNIGTNDYAASTIAGYTPTQSYVKVPVYTTLNLADGTVNGQATQEFALANIKKDEIFPVDGYEYVAMNYVLVDADKEVVDVEFTMTDGVNPKTRTVGSVPVQRNYRTNIYGALLTSLVDITVEIEPAFDEPAYDNEHDYYVSEGTYYITSANGLRWFAEQVNSRNPELLTAKVVLDQDIDLAAAARTQMAVEANWTPIGLGTNLSAGDTFRGTFDGAGHTIRNMVVNQGAVAGLFGYVYGATIKNVTIEDATINSNHYAGGVVAWVLNTTGNIQVPFVLENCHVKNSTITSAAEQVNGEWDNGDKVGGLVGYACFADANYAANAGAKISGCSVEGTTIKAYRDFGGLVGYASYVALENCSTEDVTLEQDLTHDYKGTTPDTFGLTIGKDAGNNTVDNNTYVFDGVLTDAEGVYYVYNASGLVWVAKEVNKYSNYERPFEGKTIKMLNDINLGGMEWTPIGDYRFSANRFCGTFDGQNHTISNFKITKKTDKNDSNKSSYGFFGNVEGIVKNLTVANATVNSYAYTAALVGRLNSGLIENCHVVDCEVSNTYWQGGILIGQVNGGSVKNCTVKSSSITSKSAIGAISGPVTNESNEDIVFENCVVEECEVIQKGSFGSNYDKYFGTMFGYLEAADGKCIRVNNCTVVNTTVKGESNAMFTGDIDGNIYVNGGLTVATAEALTAALQAGGDYTLVSDIYLSAPIQISGKTFSLDGNGYKIGQSSEYPAEGTAVAALLHPNGGAMTLKNVVFDGIKTDAVIRTDGTDFYAENLLVKNCNHTKDQGLFRLLGKSTIKNSTFKNNTCKMVVSLNFDGNGTNTDPQVVKNCVFEGNTCSVTAVLYYAEGGGVTVDGNKFLSNTLNVSNGATLYLGFKKNCTVTNNLFEGNVVTATSKRSSGGLMVGNAAVVTGNSFVNNTVTVNGQSGYGNNVCASPYYAAIDLSGNYWGGSAPVEGADYYKEYNNYEVIINDYLTVNPFN